VIAATVTPSNATTTISGGTRIVLMDDALVSSPATVPAIPATATSPRTPGQRVGSIRTRTPKPASKSTLRTPEGASGKWAH